MSASGGRFRVIVQAASGRSSRAHGMRSGNQDPGARRVNGPLRPGLIARMMREARVRRESFAEVLARRDRIAGRARGVRFVLAAKARAGDLRRGRRSRFVLVVRAKDLSRCRRSRFVHAVKARAGDLRRDQRSRFVRGARKASVLQGPIAKMMREARVRRESFVEGRGRRVRIAGRVRSVPFVRAAKVRAKDLLHGRRNRFGREKKASAEPRKGSRSGEQRAVIGHGQRAIGSREASLALAASQRSAPRRSLAAASGSLVASGSFPVRASRAERAGLEASRSRSLDRSLAVSRVAKRVDRGRALPSRGVRRRSSCEV